MKNKIFSKIYKKAIIPIVLAIALICSALIVVGKPFSLTKLGESSTSILGDSSPEQDESPNIGSLGDSGEAVLGASAQRALFGATISVNNVTELTQAVNNATENAIITLSDTFPDQLPNLVEFTIAHNFNIVINGNGHTLLSEGVQRHFKTDISGTGSLTFANMTLSGTVGGLDNSLKGNVILEQVTLNQLAANPIIANSNSLTLSNSTITAPKATVIANYTNLFVTDSVFTDGEAGYIGSSNQADAVLTVTNTKLLTFRGSAITVPYGATATIQNVLIKDTPVSGIGINLSTNSKVSLKNSSIIGITGASHGYAGAGIRIDQVYDIELTIDNSYFKDITASLNMRGAAIGFQNSTGTVTINNSYFEGNTTGIGAGNHNSINDGAAIYFLNNKIKINNVISVATLNVSGSVFANNHAADDAGAIFIEGSYQSNQGGGNKVTANLRNNTFYNNKGDNIYTAGSDGGGAIQLSNYTTLNAEHNTFYGNQAGYSGGAIGTFSGGLMNRSRSNLTNNIFINNTSPDVKRQNLQLATNTNKGNIGYDNNTVINAEHTAMNVFGTNTPVYATNSSGITAGYDDVTTKIVLPNYWVLPGGLVSSASVAGSASTDARGFARNTTKPTIGAIEATYISLHENAGTWAGADIPYNGTIYYNTLENKYIHASNPNTSIALEDVFFTGKLVAPFNHSFVEWNTLANGTGTSYAASATIPLTTGGVELYAIWRLSNFEVTFVPNGGTPAPNAVDIAVGDLVPEPTISRTGHTLENWYTTFDFQAGTEWNFATDSMPANNITLYAKWNINSYQVVYFPNNGTPAPTNHATVYNQPINPPAGMTRTGYTFAGWYSDPSFSEASKWKFSDEIAPTLMPANNISLYAKWNINSYLVTFHTNEGSPVPENVLAIYSSKVTKPATLTREGYSFVGWFTTPTFLPATQWDFDVNTVPDHPMDLYAKWNINSYILSFDANGGSPTPATQTIDFMNTVANPTTITKQGHTLEGWYSNSSFTESNKWAFAGEASPTAMPASNITLYAKWSVNRYDVTYHALGGTPSQVASTVPYGQPLTPPSITQKGYTVEGWYTTNNFQSGTKWSFSSDFMPDHDMDLYANWELGTYTITYDTNGAKELVPSQQVTYKSFVPKPIDITKRGNKFIGWYQSINTPAEKQWDFSLHTMTPEDLTLTAKWEPLPYDVYLNAGVGRLVGLNRIQVLYGEKIPYPQAYHDEENYFVEGWYTSSKTLPHEKWDFNNQLMSDSPLYLYAKWSREADYTGTDQPDMNNQHLFLGNVPAKDSDSYDEQQKNIALSGRPNGIALPKTGARASAVLAVVGASALGIYLLLVKKTKDDNKK